jgi:V-type H+-transporting ATPase subunit E
VKSELNKMTEFIKREAYEKAREIELKADEEFAIEKSKLVRQETAAIDLSFEKRFKTAAMSQQIAKSNVTNKTRLRVLSAKQELLDSLFEKTGVELKKTSESKSYPDIIKALILEAAYAMNEKTVLIRAREKDFDVVKKQMAAAQKEYKTGVGKDVEFKLDDKTPLPAGS